MPNNKEEESKQTLEEFLNDVGAKFQERQKALLNAYNAEVNMANRLEIKIRLEELNYLFSEVRKSVK